MPDTITELCDAIRLWKRDAVPPAEYASRRGRLEGRLAELIEGPLEPHGRPPIDQAAASPPRRFVHLSRPAGRALRQSAAADRTRHPPGGDHPQE